MLVQLPCMAVDAWGCDQDQATLIVKFAWKNSLELLEFANFSIPLAVEDMERNDGSPERPFYASKGLLKVIGKKNKAPSRPATPAPEEPIYETPI